MNAAFVLLAALSLADISQLAEEKKFSGVVLIAKDGQPLLHRAYGHTTDTPFNIASLGKMFTGVAVAQLVERGKLRYSDRVGDHLPQFPHAANVTVHQLLTHTSGIPDLAEEPFRLAPRKLGEYVPFIAPQALEFEPGRKRSYSNAGYIILGLLIEKVTGEDYFTHVQRHVLAPAGMRGTKFGKGSSPAGGVRATATDLLRFFEALRAGKLLQLDSVTHITTARYGESAGYGFGMLAYGTNRLVGHSGGDTGVSADAYTYWPSGYTIVILSDQDPPASHDIALAVRWMIEKEL